MDKSMILDSEALVSLGRAMYAYIQMLIALRGEKCEAYTAREMGYMMGTAENRFLVIQRATEAYFNSRGVCEEYRKQWANHFAAAGSIINSNKMTPTEKCEIWHGYWMALKEDCK